MCNIMAAVGGIALLMMMGGKGGKGKQEQTSPMVPQISTNYSKQASDQSAANKNLADDASSGVSSSKAITQSREQSKGGSGYRNPLVIPTQAQAGPKTTLPTIGGVNNQKPVNYG